MSDRDSIAKLLTERDWQLPQLTVETRGSMKYPELGASLYAPLAGGELGVDARYLHDRLPEGSAMLRYRRQF